MSARTDEKARRAVHFGEQQHDGRSVGGAARASASKRNYTTSAKDSRALTFYRACEWRDLNPDVWGAWERAALHEAAQGRRFSMQLMIEQTRKQDRVNCNGEPVKLNNTHCPIWARMLATEHPEVRPFIELRDSEWDIDFPEARGCV